MHSNNQIGKAAKLAAAACITAFMSMPVCGLDLTIDAAAASGTLDMGRFSLGQGGLSSRPMLRQHISALKELRPRSLRFFLQEYFGLYPAHNTYSWTKLDSTLDDIVAIGAEPIPSICFKPSVLFPVKDPAITAPNNWAEWEELIYQLVKHCRDKGYGIKRWEVGNEPDQGEAGGCPYAFKDDGSDYLPYYDHTVAGIHRADPTAKVGGPALAGPWRNLGSALLAHCGNGTIPLDFFSFHCYNNDAGYFSSGVVPAMKAKIAAYPSLANTETALTEWNYDYNTAGATNPNQPAWVLQATKGLQESGLSWSAFYHTRDFFVDPAEFRPFLGDGMIQTGTQFWNVTQPPFGIFSNAGVMRPAYFTFLWMSRLVGQKITVSGTTNEIHSLAVRNGSSVNAMIWNWAGATTNVTVRMPSTTQGNFRVMRLNADLVKIDTVRTGQASELAANPIAFSLRTYDIYYIETGSATGSAVAHAAAMPAATIRLFSKSFLANAKGPYQIEIFTACGSIIRMEEGKGEQSFSIRDLSPGVYSIVLRAGIKTLCTKSIVYHN
jgi:hypothetical protein